MRGLTIVIEVLQWFHKDPQWLLRFCDGSTKAGGVIEVLQMVHSGPVRLLWSYPPQLITAPTQFTHPQHPPTHQNTY